MNKLPTSEQILDCALSMTSASALWEKVFVGLVLNDTRPQAAAREATEAVRAALEVIYPSLLRYNEDLQHRREAEFEEDRKLNEARLGAMFIDSKRRDS